MNTKRMLQVILVAISIGVPVVLAWYLLLAFTGLLGLSLAGPICFEFLPWLVGVVLLYESLILFPAWKVSNIMRSQFVTVLLPAQVPGIVALTFLIYWIFIASGC